MADEFKFPDEMDNAVQVNSPVTDEIEVEIIDDTPSQDRGRKPLDRDVEDPSDEEIESYSDKVKVRIKELTHARHDERRAKEATLREKQELERFAQQLLEENKSLKQYVDTGTEQYVITAKAAAEAELEKVRRQYKDAQEAFDTDAIIAAQEALTEAKLKLESIKNFRPAPLQQQETPVQQQTYAPQPVQPDEKTLRWQAKNQWFGANGYEEVTSYALGLHQKLVNSGVNPQSDEYFQTIDTRLHKTFPDMFGGSTSKKPASVVAPATRSSGKKVVQLTNTQLALARKFGLTPQQYAAQVSKLENANG
jgi:hypothetical protein